MLSSNVSRMSQVKLWIYLCLPVDFIYLFTMHFRIYLVALFTCGCHLSVSRSFLSSWTLIFLYLYLHHQARTQWGGGGGGTPLSHLFFVCAYGWPPKHQILDTHKKMCSYPPPPPPRLSLQNFRRNLTPPPPPPAKKSCLRSCSSLTSSNFVIPSLRFCFQWLRPCKKIYMFSVPARFLLGGRLLFFFLKEKKGPPSYFSKKQDAKHVCFLLCLRHRRWCRRHHDFGL